MPWYVLNKLVKTHINTLPQDDEDVSIHVNRKKATDFAASGKVDRKGDQTIFSQVWRKLESGKYRGLRINHSDKKAWFVKFIGEYALDDGGLFRESLSELCQELKTDVLPLMVKTANQ